MLTRPQSIYRTTLTGAAGVSAAAIQTLEDKTTLVIQPRRLAGIDMQIRLTTSAVAYTATHTGILGIIKAIRLLVNDITGNQRPCIDVKGPEIYQFVKNCEIFPDRFSEQAVVGDFNGLAVSTAYIINLFIPCYDPELGEKAIPFMSIPLYALQETAVLQVDLGVAADIGAAGGITGNVFVDWAPCYRLRDDNYATYIPWELKTDRRVWPATGQGEYQFVQDGILTKFMVSNMTTAALRGNILNNTQLFELKQGQTTIFQYNEALQIGRGDRVTRAYPQSGTAATAPTPALAYRNIPNCHFVSLVKDPSTGEAFGIQSAIDLRPKVGNAERVSLFFNDISTAGYISDITMFRVKPQNDKDLVLLGGGV